MLARQWRPDPCALFCVCGCRTWDLPVAIRHPSSSLIHSRSPLVIGMLRVRKYALTITSWLILENGVEPIPGLIRGLCSVFEFLGCGKFPLRGRS